MLRKSSALEVAKYEALRKKLNYADYVYRNKNFRPNVYFYRYLAPSPTVSAAEFPRHNRLKIWVPNTVVYDGLSSPFWVYSRDSYVYRTDSFTLNQVVARMGSASKQELVAIAKAVQGSRTSGSRSSTRRRVGWWATTWNC